MFTESQIEEVKALAKPLAQWLADNYHPHCQAIVTSTNVEITEGVIQSKLDTVIPE